jgi:hypothetical protein
LWHIVRLKIAVDALLLATTIAAGAAAAAGPNAGRLCPSVKWRTECTTLGTPMTSMRLPFLSEKQQIV